MPPLTLLKNRDWRIIEERVCRVTDFTPMAILKDGKVLDISITLPYGAVKLECEKFPGQEITGYITNKLDFANLWKAFKERGVGPDEEVLIIWTTKRYNFWLYKLLSPGMAKLWVMVCHKGAFELITNPKLRRDLTGEAWAKAVLPIIDWKPEVMK